ncbi:unnamed protein product [Rhizoctonia solani]|uniref:Uncharacterized protein n=1 Tax=Rhizoctonia solani TaxID=456999 RepID=A0A8H3DWM1_9AGAM|nr:unnamed protein product [Rhizoctonia solani]
MRVTTSRHLVYSFTGVPKPESKPFDTVTAVNKALDEVRRLIANARTRVKGLKIINNDPVPKSSVFLKSLVETPKGSEKMSGKKRKAKAEAEALDDQEEFIMALLRQWPRCKNGPCNNAHCYPSASGLHVPLTHEATNIWSMAYRENPNKVTLTTPPQIMPSNKKPKHEPKVAGHLPVEFHGLSNLKGKGESAAEPIEIDLESAGAGPSNTSKAEKEPIDYIDLVSEFSDSHWKSNSPQRTPKPIRATSTRLPSPTELFKLLFHRIGILLQHLDAENPNLHALDYAPRFRASGIERIDQVPEHSVNWLVENLHIPVREASLIHSSALCHLRK